MSAFDIVFKKELTDPVRIGQLFFWTVRPFCRRAFPGGETPLSSSDPGARTLRSRAAGP